MLTDEEDLVIDPFAGSCATGEVCERLRRRWLCVELKEPYLKGAVGRFTAPGGFVSGADSKKPSSAKSSNRLKEYFKLPRIGLLWGERTTDKLPKDGGKKRRPR